MIGHVWLDKDLYKDEGDKHIGRFLETLKGLENLADQLFQKTALTFCLAGWCLIQTRTTVLATPTGCRSTSRAKGDHPGYMYVEYERPANKYAVARPWRDGPEAN